MVQTVPDLRSLSMHTLDIRSRGRVIRRDHAEKRCLWKMHSLAISFVMQGMLHYISEMGRLFMQVRKRQASKQVM